MKKVFTRVLLCGIVAAVIYSCDNGNADVTVFNAAPVISFPENIASITAGQAADLSVTVTDGEVSSLSSGTITLLSGMNEVATKTQSLSGSSATLTLTAAETDIVNLAPGGYRLAISVTDSENSTSNDTTNVAIVCEALPACMEAGKRTVIVVAPSHTTSLAGFEQVGLVGSLTGWGGDPDIAMTQISANCFCAAVDFPESVEYKFRLNSNWDFVEKRDDCSEENNRTEIGSAPADGEDETPILLTVGEWRNSDQFGGSCPN